MIQISAAASMRQMNGEDRCGHNESLKVSPLQRYPVKDGWSMALSAMLAIAQKIDRPEAWFCAIMAHRSSKLVPFVVMEGSLMPFAAMIAN